MTQLEKLRHAVATNQFKLNKNSFLYFCLKNLAENGSVRTFQQSYSGGFVSTKKCHEELKNILQNLKINFIEGNDAPRGGKLGIFLQLGKSSLNQIKKERDAVRISEEEEYRQREEELRKNFALLLNGSFDERLKTHAGYFQNVVMHKRGKDVRAYLCTLAKNMGLKNNLEFRSYALPILTSADF